MGEDKKGIRVGGKSEHEHGNIGWRRSEGVDENINGTF